MDQDMLEAIEETQAALRESIELAKELADDSDRLLRKHREEAPVSRRPNRPSN